MTKRQIPLISPGWWRETDTPRWILVLGAAAAILVNYGIEEYRARNTERASQVGKLIDSSQDFQAFAAAFASEMFNQKVASRETRNRLIENLNDQYAHSGGLPENIAIAAKPEISEFQRSVLAMIDAVQKANGIMSMQEFWTAASNLTVSRKRLSIKLRSLT